MVDEKLEALITALRWIQEEAVEARSALIDDGDCFDGLQRIYDRCSYELEKVRER
jgi:hypothetical protein